VAHIEGDIVIRRPVEVVFDFVADTRNEPRYNSRMLHVEKASDGPVGLGTRFEARTRSGGRDVPLLVEITKYERARSLASRTHLSGMDIEGTLTFEPVPGGTRMSWSWSIEPHGLPKLLSPLIGWMGERQERAIWTGLKTHLEGAAA